MWSHKCVIEVFLTSDDLCLFVPCREGRCQLFFEKSRVHTHTHSLSLSFTHTSTRNLSLGHILYLSFSLSFCYPSTRTFYILQTHTTTRTHTHTHTHEKIFSITNEETMRVLNAENVWLEWSKQFFMTRFFSIWN